MFCSILRCYTTCSRLSGGNTRFRRAAVLQCFSFSTSSSAHSADETNHNHATSSSTTAAAAHSDNDSSSSSLSSLPSLVLQGYSLQAADCNVPLHIAQRVGRNLHCRPNHPLSILQKHILEFFQSKYDDDDDEQFELFDDLSPIVSTEKNFDLLRIPADHVSRSLSDTYYLNPETVLRTHTSAHQIDLLQAKYNRFLVSGDVYRRDEIDRSHYPIFHQMEGVKVFTADDFRKTAGADFTREMMELASDKAKLELIERDLKQTLEGLAIHLFGADTEMRWVDEYFPFTHPSFELEILFDNQEWMEVLGCGVIHPDIMQNAGRGTEQGWAFGLGLERLAMILFQIPDIRLFWTDDERFHQQFAQGKIVPFEPYSKYPPCYKDMSFWIDKGKSAMQERDDNNNDGGNYKFHVNDLNELVRDIAGDLVEQVTLIDHFTHPKTGRTSHCYRISYRSMDRNLTNEEIDALQEQVRERTVCDLGVELR